MKKRILVVVLFVDIAIISILTSCAVKQPGPPPSNQSSASYYMEQLAPDIIRIVGLTVDEFGDFQFGYGTAFAKAIKDIKEKYDIVQIIPITYKWYYASITRELIVTVKPK